MKKLLTIMAMTAMMTFSLNAADLVGTWKGSMETQMGKTEVTIAITPGATLAGKVTLAEYEGRIENAKQDGDKVSFDVNLEHGKIAFAGTVAGDEMKFTVTGTRGDDYLLVCKRQK